MKTFIDLFAGLGGFHIGLSHHGLQCVFASELDEQLSEIYNKNFGIKPYGDIRKVDEHSIPAHDILCAGFPCQPFSSAGKKQGAKCPKSGRLIDEVIRIAAFHQPRYVFLENVPQILTIQNGEFWQYICSEFQKLGYHINYQIYSPDEFGIPQKRKRIFIIASKAENICFPVPQPKISSVNDILLDNITYEFIEYKKQLVLNHWQTFLINIKNVSSHTILAAEFGATYPVGNLKNIDLNTLKKFNGAFGSDLSLCNTYDDIFALMPEYIRKTGEVPSWIRSSVLNSRKIYEKHSDFLDQWKQHIKNCKYNSWQKLEWRAGKSNLSFDDKIIQFRASGIRISTNKHTPSLVAMTPTQVPIVGKQMRYLGINEAAQLQAMGDLEHLPKQKHIAFKALGNAVNAKIVSFIVAALLQESHCLPILVP